MARSRGRRLPRRIAHEAVSQQRYEAEKTAHGNSRKVIFDLRNQLKKAEELRNIALRATLSNGAVDDAENEKPTNTDHLLLCSRLPNALVHPLALYSGFSMLHTKSQSPQSAPSPDLAIIRQQLQALSNEHIQCVITRPPKVLE